MQKQDKRSYFLSKIIELFFQFTNGIKKFFSKSFSKSKFSDKTSSEQPALKSFYSKLLISNLLLLALLVVSYVGCEYIEWHKTIKTEVKNLKALINRNIANYSSIVELIEKQINSKGISSLDSLNTQKYNSLFSFDKSYIPLANIHYVLESKNQNKTSYNQQGKETFVILPNDEFLYSIEDQKTLAYLIEPQHDLIFITKAIKYSEKTIFLVLKIELNKFITSMDNKLNLSCRITLTNNISSKDLLDIVSNNRISSKDSSKTSNDSLIVLNDKLPFSYKSPSFFEILYKNMTENNVIGFLLLALSLNSIICLWQTRNFCSNLAHYFVTKIEKVQSVNKILRVGERNLKKHLNNLEQAISQGVKIYNGFISSLDEEILALLELNDLNEISTIPFIMNPAQGENKKHNGVYINLIELLNNCKTALYLDFYFNQVQCKTSFHYNKNIQLENPWILFILVINYIKQAIERTPANNKILINIFEEDNYLTIRIEDTCFNFNCKDITEFNLFKLPEETLQRLAEYSSIQISTISDNEQNRITELKIKIDQNDNSSGINIKQVDNVLYIFKGN